jgi:hypothetical protein
MSQRFNTVLSNPRIRDPRDPQPSLPAPQRAEKQALADDINGRKNAYILQWMTFTTEIATKMSEEFGDSVRHCQDLLHCAGMRLVHSRPNGNAWNAFLALKTLELKEGKAFLFVNIYLIFFLSEDPEAPKLDAVEMHALFSQEYNELSDLEKEELVEKHRELKTDRLKFRRPTARGRVLDVSNAILNLKKIVSSPFPFI